MKEKGELVNCKKCGSLFIKNSRDICENCFSTEIELIDKIKHFVNENSQNKVNLSEIIKELKIDKLDLEDLIERGKLFSIMPKLIIKCRFCGVEIEDEQSKINFICTKCLNKFSPKGELAKINALKEEQKEKEKELSSKKTRRAYFQDSKDRCGFIQNFDI